MGTWPTPPSWKKDIKLHRIIELCTDQFCLCPNISTKFRTKPYLKASPNKNDSNKTWRYCHYLSLYQNSFNKEQLFMSCLQKQNTNFILQQLPRSYFSIFIKTVLLNVVLSCTQPSEYNISWSHVDWCKSCIHLRSVLTYGFHVILRIRNNFFLKQTIGLCKEESLFSLRYGLIF